MSQKRHSEDSKPLSEETFPEDKRRKGPAFGSVVLEAMKLHSVANLLEPLIRRVVKEEVESALKKYSANMRQDGGKGVDTPELRILQLKFENNILLPVFTGARIEGEDSNLRIALVDTATGQIVCFGPESSSKVEIVVLEGDFDGDESEDGTSDEFRNNIVREREGKKPLLTGDLFFNLVDGTGVVGEISFTDNSSWTRSRRFRLGARVVEKFDRTRVREAKTESFIVRDHRGELYKKHHPPSLLDEVWRLEKIGKDGAFHRRLSREKINTVKDFLTHLFIDPVKLRTILGTGMSAKMWEVTVEHARTCVLDKRRFLYFPPHSQQKAGVVFNVVGQIMGLRSDCQFVPVDRLSEAEKNEAQTMVTSAFQHQEDVVECEEEALFKDSSPYLTNMNCTSSSPRTENSTLSKILTPHKIDGFDFANPSIYSPDIVSSIFSIGGGSGLEDYPLAAIDNMDLRYNENLSYPSQANSPLVCDSATMAQAFSVEEHLPYFDSNLQTTSQADLQSALDGFLYNKRPNPVTFQKAQRRWTKLFSVLKWFSIRRIVALKRARVQDVHTLPS